MDPILREAVNSFPRRGGVVCYFCPKCEKIHKREKTEINILNDWAFKDGICITTDGHGCCFK